jgi:DNA invertase Pin-like site-specific DNA recombinase
MSKRRRISPHILPVGSHRRTQPEAALDFISPISEIDPRENPKVVVYYRASGRAQKNSGKFAWQKQLTESYLPENGYEIVGTFEIVICGRHFRYRSALRQAVALARKTGAIVVAATRDRFVRAVGYNGTHQSDRPTLRQYEELCELADGVTLATIIPPETSPEAVRSIQVNGGHQAAGNKGGRPRKKKPCPPGHKKRQREAQLPMALELHQQGYSLSQIANHLGRPRPTIQSWIKKHFRNC